MDRTLHLLDSSGEAKEKPEPDGTGPDYQEIAREVLARIDQRLADLDQDNSSASGIMSSDHQAAFVRMALRGLIGLLLSASLVAAISFLWSHRDMAKRTVGQSVSRLDPGSATPAEKPEPRPPAAPKTIAEAAPAQAAPLPAATPDHHNADSGAASSGTGGADAEGRSQYRGPRAGGHGAQACAATGG